MLRETKERRILLYTYGLYFQELVSTGSKVLLLFFPNYFI